LRGTYYGHSGYLTGGYHSSDLTQGSRRKRQSGCGFDVGVQATGLAISDELAAVFLLRLRLVLRAAVDHPIKRYRTLRGLSLRALALATKIPHVRLHHIEHGRQATLEEKERIARVLVIPEHELTTEAARG
jgi:hypothetical protein